MMKPEQTETKPDKILCESCGEEFSCGANAEKCWCFEVDLSSETLAELRENFKSCLCQNCLTEKAESRSEFQHGTNLDFR